MGPVEPLRAPRRHSGRGLDALSHGEAVRLAVGFTTERGINNLIFLRWLELLSDYPATVDITYARGAPGFAAARNIVMRRFWETTADALLFWDSDQLPPRWVRYRGEQIPTLDYLHRVMADEPDKEVIAGLYWSRDIGVAGELPFEPLAYEFSPAQGDEPEGFRRCSVQTMVKYVGERGLYPVAAAGTGSMLIRRSVLERLRDAKAPAPLFEQPQLGSGRQREWQWTEDLFFCHELRTRLDPPVQVWLDSRLESGHQTDVWVNAEHYLATRRQMIEREHTQRAALERAAAQARSPIWTPR